MIKGQQGSQFHGLELAVRVFSGAAATRVVHPACQPIEEHRHDWPMLTLHTLGGYTEIFDDNEVTVGGPAALLHPAGSPHADRVGDEGLETLSIEFDPDWLRCAGELFLDRPRCWIGGGVGAAARELASVWTHPGIPETIIAEATASFLWFALAETEPRRPDWLDRVDHALEGDKTPPSTRLLARRLGLHPAWLCRAYRSFTGEGLRETVRRRQTQRAAVLLRETDLPLAEIALASGFCDQSHMNRTFRALAGRTPLQVRAEGSQLRNLALSAGPAPPYQGEV